MSKPIVRFKDVSFKYERGPTALKGISLQMHLGEFVSIVGQNGAGKTTLAKHMNGLLKPTDGDVIVDGMNTREVSVADLARVTGYVFQNPDHQFFAPSVEEEVAFGPKNLKLGEGEVVERVDEALSTVGLEAMRERHPYTLSRGQRQRLAVASVLAMRPKVVMLDEPTTGQDEVAINQVMLLVDRLRRGGKTVVMITHDMSITTKYAERTIVMRGGEVLLDGPTKEVFSRPEVLSKSSIEVPPISRLAQMLTDFGIPRSVFTVDELCNQVLRIAGG